MKAALLTLVALFGARANVTLPAVISDRMVLQQGAPARIWGRADPGEAVTVSFRDQKASTTADSAGKWKTYLKPLEAGGPYDMTVSGQDTVVVKDILVGEVWVGSGQSNMGFTMARVNNSEHELYSLREC